MCLQGEKIYPNVFDFLKSTLSALHKMKLGNDATDQNKNSEQVEVRKDRRINIA